MAPNPKGRDEERVVTSDDHAGPLPLEIVQALRDLSCNHLFRRIAARWWVWLVGYFAFILVVARLFGSKWAKVGILVPFLLVLLLVQLYLLGHARFSNQIREKRPRCPHCKRVVWHICCSDCRNPLPTLALLYSGRFLRYCPTHDCGRFPDTRGSRKTEEPKSRLVGWCHNCHYVIDAPSEHFASRTEVEISLVSGKPGESIDPDEGWQVVAKQPPHAVKFQRVLQGTRFIKYRLGDDWPALDAVPVPRLVAQSDHHTIRDVSITGLDRSTRLRLAATDASPRVSRAALDTLEDVQSLDELRTLATSRHRHAKIAAIRQVDGSILHGPLSGVFLEICVDPDIAVCRRALTQLGSSLTPTHIRSVLARASTRQAAMIDLLKSIDPKDVFF